MTANSCVLKLTFIALACAASVGHAQQKPQLPDNFPNKAIRIFVSPVGGGSDLLARMLAPGVASSMGQSVIVENRGMAVSGDTVARAQPDGYTVLLAANSFTIGSLLQKTPYDLFKVFSAVTSAAGSPNILVVHPSMPVKSVKELISLAKAKPGVLNYASSGLGGASHLATELFKSMAGVDIVRVNYQGGGTAVNGMVGGEVGIMFATAGSVTPHVKSGRLRALAVTSAQPSALVPGMPTVAASGVPGYEAGQNYAVFVPAKTPDAIINRLNQEIVRVLNQPEVKQKLFNTGAEVVGNAPEESMAAIKSELVKMGKVIKDAGIRAE